MKYLSNQNFQCPISTPSLQITGGSSTDGIFTWNSADETIDVTLGASTGQLFEEEYIHVKNSSGSLIPDRTAVRKVGTDGMSGHILIAPMIADGTVSPNDFLGITTNDIANGGFGKVTTFGKINGVNTSIWPDNTDLWLDPAVPGGFTSTKPAAPNLKINPAYVIASHAVNGKIFVRVNAGTDLHNNHRVHILSPDANGNPQVDGQLLRWNDTLNRWENWTSNYLTTSNVSGTTNYISKFTGTNTLGNSSFYDAGTPTVWVTGQNANSRFYFSPVHADGRINFNAVANTNDYTLLRAWHDSNQVGLGTGSSAGGGALTARGDSILIGTSGALYFMNGTFGPNNVPYRLGITTSATATYFTSGVNNNLTNIESNEFIYTAKSHTFYTGTTTGNQSQPNQYTPLFLSTTGNVGIGTTSPTSKLHVVSNVGSDGTSLYTGYAQIVQNTKDGDTIDGVLLLVNQNGGSGGRFLSGINNQAGGTQRFYIDGNGSYFGVSGTFSGNLKATKLYWNVDNDGWIGDNSQDGTFVIVTDGTEKFRVKQGGNVGINETNPTARLQVKGTGSTSSTTSLLVQNSAASSALTITDDKASTFNGNVTIGSSSEIDANSRYLVINGGYGNTSSDRVLLYLAATNNSGYGVGSKQWIYLGGGGVATSAKIGGINLGNNNYESGLVFNTTSGGNDYEVMRITNSQNVGIGTTAPTYKLEVQGNGLFRTTTSSTPLVVAHSGSTAVQIENNATGNRLRLSTLTTYASIDTPDTYLTINPNGVKTNIGTSTNLNATLGIKGSGSTSATTSLLVQNSSAFQLLKVTDDGQCLIGGDGLTTFPLQVYGNSGLQIQVGNSFFSYNAVRTIRFLNANNGIPLNHEIVNQVSNTDNSNYVYFRNNNTQTSGSMPEWKGISIETIVQTQSSAVATQLSITPTLDLNVNTISSSIQRGIYYNPTITNLRTAKHYGIQTTSGGAYINTTTPQASACLQADSTTQGFLPPRMTNTQVNAISTPATGLQAYDTTNNKNMLYNGSSWQSIATESYVNTQITNLINGAPAALDTLNELSAALGNDANFATTVTNSLASKVPNTRTLTINGTTYDLSANRSWTVSSDLQSAVNTSKVTTPVNPGANVVASFSVASYDGATFNYVLKDGTNFRAGTVVAVWNGATVQYNETTTNDIGNTTSVVLSVAINAGNAELIATSGTPGWTMKVVPIGI